MRSHEKPWLSDISTTSRRCRSVSPSPLQMIVSASVHLPLRFTLKIVPTQASDSEPALNIAWGKKEFRLPACRESLDFSNITTIRTRTQSTTVAWSFVRAFRSIARQTLLIRSRWITTCLIGDKCLSTRAIYGDSVIRCVFTVRDDCLCRTTIFHVSQHDAYMPTVMRAIQCGPIVIKRARRE